MILSLFHKNTLYLQTFFKSYLSGSVNSSEKSKEDDAVKSEARITVEPDGTKNYHYRDDLTNTGIARMSLFPQEMTIVRY